MPITQTQASKAIDHLDLPGPADQRFALAIIRAVETYERLSRQPTPRLSEVRRELEHLADANVRQTAERLTGISEEAMTWLGIEPDAPTGACPSTIRRWLSSLSEPRQRSKTMGVIRDRLAEALEVLPTDPGGQPRDQALIWLVSQIGELYEIYTDRASPTGNTLPEELSTEPGKTGQKPWEGWVEPGRELDHPFWCIVLMICPNLEPPISPAKARTYIQTFLGWVEQRDPAKPGRRPATVRIDWCEAPKLKLSIPRAPHRSPKLSRHVTAERIRAFRQRLLDEPDPEVCHEAASTAYYRSLVRALLDNTPFPVLPPELNPIAAERALISANQRATRIRNLDRRWAGRLNPQ